MRNHESTNATEGSILQVMLTFSVPYLIACFLQTFYGMADLFITGQFNGAGSISAVAVGSQVMHMVTLVIAGLAMGTTVNLSRALGGRDRRQMGRIVGNTVSVFLVFAALLTTLLLVLTQPILTILSVPPEAWSEAQRYAGICFVGVPFITAYNVISSIFRGLGDTRRPMYFVAIAGVINIGLDYLLIGPFHMGAAGAAYATVLSQLGSVLMALPFLKRALQDHISTDQYTFRAESLRPDMETLRAILGVGLPICFQDTLIQISFLTITAIANSRGVDVAAAVGIVEKIITFAFLVPSALLSTVSALAAQNAGAGRHDRSREILHTGIRFAVLFGAVITVVSQFAAPGLVSLFVHDDPHVIELGAQYMRTYSADVLFGGVQFCFSGFFTAYKKSVYSFIHNLTSALCVRIPIAWLSAALFPQTLYVMGLAGPCGSLVSILICLFLYRRREWK